MLLIFTASGMKKGHIFLLVLFQACFSFAQKDYQTKELSPFLFYNYQRSKCTVIDDSTGCHEYNFKTKSWDFRPLTFELEEPFSRFVEIYHVLHERGTEIFFVDKGCGIVYMLKNDTVKRHDLSGHQENQYNGTFFLQDGEPHIFGGYGLFQFKNIITRYDVQDREWFCYDINGGITPGPRQSSFGQVINNKLYIIGGLGGKTKASDRYNDVWSFDFLSLKWNRLGIFNACKQDDKTRIVNQAGIQCSPLFLRYDLFYELNFPKGIRRAYRLSEQGKIRALIPVGSTCLVHKIDTKGLYSLVSVVNRSEIFDKELFHGPLIQPAENGNTWALFGWGIFLFLFLGILVNYFLFFRSKKRAPRNITSTMSTNEKMLLDVILSGLPEGIEISMVNDIVSHDSPSVDTLKKRRDTLLREFRQKLATTFRLHPDEVFIEEKHPTDKRVKILKLNQKITDKLKNPNRGK